jgi:hypothetical protein
MTEWILILVMILAVMEAISLLLIVWLIGYIADAIAGLPHIRPAEGFHASSAKPWETA